MMNIYQYLVVLPALVILVKAGEEIVDSPLISNVLYVDGNNGRDWKDGQTEENALKTLQKAAKLATSGTQILVKDGIYQNYRQLNSKHGKGIEILHRFFNRFGSGNLNNPVVLSLKDLTDVSVQNFPGHSPVIEFDGAGGISMSGVARIEISGLEIKGPNQKITKAQAKADRLLHSNYFSGRGIAVWSGSHIRIRQNKASISSHRIWQCFNKMCVFIYLG